MRGQGRMRVKKFYLSLAALAVVVSGIALFGFLNTNSEAAIPRDECNAGSNYNAIIKCGAGDASELARKYRENPKGDLDNIYKHYGLTENEVTHANGSTGAMGRVYKDGTIKVGNKTVATNAQSLGRHNKPGSHKVSIGGKTYYERKPSATFQIDSISAFVFFEKNGDFKAAILTACGNPVRADKPVYKCEDLTKKAVSRNRYEFTAHATAKNGAKVSSYTFDFGDGKKQQTSNRTVAHTYAKPGNYTVKVTVKVKINNAYYKETTSTNCKVTVTVAPEPSYACKDLKLNKISRTKYEFTASATAANGAQVTGYKYDFGDGQKKDNASAKESHTYAKPGNYTVKVWAIVKIGGATKHVTSNDCVVKVTVTPEPPKPAYTCESLSKKNISRTEFTFTGKATAVNGATIAGYIFDFGDGTKSEVTNPTNVPHTYAQPGEYTVKMTAKVMVNGEQKLVTSPYCEVKVKVAPPNKVEVCNPATGETIIVDEDEADNYVPVGDPACEPVRVCDPETGEIITVDKKDEGNYKPIGDPACEPVQVCDPETGETITVDKKDEDKYKPVGDPACEEKPEECIPGVPVGDERCEEEEECVPNPKGNETCEEIPAELPTTGPAETIGGIVGLGSLVAAGYYWYASRRGLMSEMLNR